MARAHNQPGYAHAQPCTFAHTFISAHYLVKTCRCVVLATASGGRGALMPSSFDKDMHKYSHTRAQELLGSKLECTFREIIY